VIIELLSGPPDEPNGGPLYIKGQEEHLGLSLPQLDPSMWTSRISGYVREYYEEYTTYNGGSPHLYNRKEIDDAEVYYTLVDTDPHQFPNLSLLGGQL
jgi:hypothetical protein